MGEYEGDQLYATYNKLTKEITMQSVEKPKLIGKAKVHNYAVNVDKAIKGDEISATLIDMDSKKEYKVSKKHDKESKEYDKVQAQGVIMVPLIQWLGAPLLAYLIEVVAIVIVVGVTYVALSSVLDKIKRDSYSYYAAYTVPGDAVYIGGAINYSSAVARLQFGPGFDVFAKTSSLAYTAAQGAGYGLTPVGPEIGSSPGEQYWHYHPYLRWFGTHSFFATWG